MKTWTIPEKLQALMALPWNVRVRHEDGEFVAEVEELPAVLATGATEAALGTDLYQAIEAVLEAMLVHGDAITLPAGSSAPWLEDGVVVSSRVAEIALDRTATEAIRARSKAAAQTFTKAFA